MTNINANIDAQIMSKIENDVRFAFCKFSKAVQKAGVSVQQFKKSLQNYIYEVNKIVEIGQYKVKSAKLPRKLKKKMRKQNKFVFTIQKIDAIKEIKTEIEVE